MLKIQDDNISEVVKVECEHDQRTREYRERDERERERRRAQTVGELIDALGQDITRTARDEIEDTLSQILDRARVFFADNEVCRGALTIAATAIYGGVVWRGAHLTKYLVLLADELQAARGAGYFDLYTRTRLDKITDLLPREDDDDPEVWVWPSPEDTTRYYHIKL
jgi:hypothetical protein